MNWKGFARFCIMITGTIACLGCAVGLTVGDLHEGNMVIRIVEAIVMYANFVALLYLTAIDMRKVIYPYPHIGMEIGGD